MRDKYTPTEMPGSDVENLAQTIERLAVTGENTTIFQVEPTDGGSVDAMLVPDGYRLHMFNHMARAPVRTIGDTQVESLHSLCVLIKRFKVQGSTVIFHGNALNPFVHVVFDYSDRDAPGFGQHSATFTFTRTLEFAAWWERNERLYSQDSFAQFIEDYADNIEAADEGGDAMLLIEAARSFRALRKVEFERENRDHDGTLHMLYSESTEASPRGGVVKVPEEFTVAVQPFEGASREHFRARFRYRVTREKGVEMGFRFVRPDKVLEPLVSAALKELTSFGLPMIQVASAEAVHKGPQ